MDGLVGALAIFTLGAAIIIAGIFHLRSLKDPKNMNAAKSIVRDESSAHTAVRGGDAPGHMGG